MTLQILVCTVAERFSEALQILMPARIGMSYVFSVQGVADKESLPRPTSLADRNDVVITTMQELGLSANRNNAIAHATADILLFADDDLTLYEEAISEIIHLYESNDDLDIATFMLHDCNADKNTLLRTYPHKSFTYAHRPKGTYFMSCEITVRRTAPIVPFDTRFGLGTDKLICGEEEIFIHQSFCNGCNIMFFPIAIGRVPGNTTGKRFVHDKKVRRSKGGVLYIMHGYWGAVLRCAKYALFHSPRRHSIRFFIDMHYGIWYIRKTSGQIA